MTLLPALLLITVFSQEPVLPPFNKSLPKVPPVLWSIGDNAFARVTFEFVRMSGGGSFVDQCMNRCRGQKHFTHEQCDDSCDTRCVTIHSDPGATISTHNTDESRNSIRAILNQFGMGTVGPNAANSLSSSIGEHARNNISSMDHLKIDIPGSHWVRNPCTLSERFSLIATFRLNAHLQLIRDTLRPDGSISTVEGPKVDIIAGNLYAPTSDITYKNYVRCECAIVMEGHLEEENEEIGGVFIDPDNGDGKEEMQFCNSTLQGTVGLTCTADSMTSCTFAATNPTDKEIEICVYPGTELICSDDKTQNIGTCGTARLIIPPGKSGPFLPSTASVKVRAVCLNMNKKEPDGSSKFKIGGSSSDPLRRLARFSEKERFKSVVEQMRVWIVTDQATLAEMQKHLMFPKPTPGQYLRAIETVSTVAKEDLTEPKYAKCLDPALIAGAPTTLEALNCFVGLMERANPQGLSKAASNPKTFETLWADDATKYGAEHTAWVANALGSSANLELQTAAGNFLTNVVPVARREEVAAAGGLAGVGYWQMGTDEVKAKKSLEILSAYRSKSSLLYLFNPNPTLSEAIRLEAKKLADEILKSNDGTLLALIRLHRIGYIG